MSFLKDHIGRRLGAPAHPQLPEPSDQPDSGISDAQRKAAAETIVTFLQSCRLRRREVSRWILTACAQSQESPGSADLDVVSSSASCVPFYYLRLTHFALVRARQFRLLLRDTDNGRSDGAALQSVVGCLFNHVAREVGELSQGTTTTTANVSEAAHFFMDICAVVFSTHALALLALSAPALLPSSSSTLPGLRVTGVANSAFLACIKQCLALFEPSAAPWRAATETRGGQLQQSLLTALMKAPVSIWPLLPPATTRCLTALLAKLSPPAGTVDTPSATAATPTLVLETLVNVCSVHVNRPLEALVRACCVAALVSCPSCADGPVLTTGTAAMCAKALLTVLRKIHQCLLACQGDDVSPAVSELAVHTRLYLQERCFILLSSVTGEQPAVFAAQTPLLASFLALKPRHARSLQAPADVPTPHTLQVQLVSQLSSGRHASHTLERVRASLREEYITQWLHDLPSTVEGNDDTGVRVVENPFEADGQLLVRLAMVADLMAADAKRSNVALTRENLVNRIRGCAVCVQQWGVLIGDSTSDHTHDGHSDDPSGVWTLSQGEVRVLSIAFASRCARSGGEDASAVSMPGLSAALLVVNQSSNWFATFSALLELSVTLWHAALTAASLPPANAAATATLPVVSLRGDWIAEPLHYWQLRGASLTVAPSSESSPATAAADGTRSSSSWTGPSLSAQHFTLTRLAAMSDALTTQAMGDELLHCFHVLWSSEAALLLSTPLETDSFLTALSPRERRLVALVAATQNGRGTYSIEVDVSSAETSDPASPPSTPGQMAAVGESAGGGGSRAMHTVRQLAARLGVAFHLVPQHDGLKPSSAEKEALKICQARFTDRARDVVQRLNNTHAQSSEAMRLIARLRTFATPAWVPLAEFLLHLSNNGVRGIGVSYLLHGGLSLAGVVQYCCGRPSLSETNTAASTSPACPAVRVSRRTTRTGTARIVFPSPIPSTSLAACDLLGLLHSPSTRALLETYTRTFAVNPVSSASPASSSSSASWSQPSLMGVVGPPLQALNVVHIAYSTLGSMLVNVLMLQDDAGLKQNAMLPLPVLRVATYVCNFYIVTRLLITTSSSSDASTRAHASRAKSSTAVTRTTASTTGTTAMSATVQWDDTLKSVVVNDRYATSKHFLETVQLLSARSVRVTGLSALLSTFSPSISETCTVDKLTDGDTFAVACLLALPHLFPFPTRVAVLRGCIKKRASLYTTSTVNLYRTFTGQVVAISVPRKFPLRIRRTHVLDDAMTQISEARTTMAGSQLLYSTWHVTFIGASGVAEAGVDVGGLFKEFWELCVTALLEADRGLFTATASEDGDSEGVVFAGSLYPSPNAATVVGSSSVAYELFAFAGLLLAKGISEGLVVQNTFATFFLSNLLGSGVCLEDLAELDPVEYRSLVRLRDMPTVEEACLFFAYEDHSFGGHVTHDLIPNGRNVPVTNANVVRYLHLYAHFRLAASTRFGTDAFREGLLTLLMSPNPSSASSESREGMRLLRLFNPVEVRQLFSGAETDGTRAAFDVADLEQHTVCQGASRRAVRYLFDVLRELSPRDQSLFLRFCTGSSRPPLMGFGAMVPLFTISGSDAGSPGGSSGSSGSANPLGFVRRLFQSSSSDSSGSGRSRGVARLPTASTCFNLLHLPAYDSKETLKERLLVAIRSDAGFGLS